MGEDQTRSALKQQVYVRPGGVQGQWDGMIKQEDLRSNDKFTYFLEERKGNGMG